MLPAGFETAVAASERPRILALDRSVIGIGRKKVCTAKFIVFKIAWFRRQLSGSVLWKESLLLENWSSELLFCVPHKKVVATAFGETCLQIYILPPKSI